jgi:cytochrome bd-type quinol oxidase subunit 2
MRKLLAIAMLVIAGISTYLLVFVLLKGGVPLRHGRLATATFVMFFAINLLIILALLIIAVRLLRGNKRAAYEARLLFAVSILYFIVDVIVCWLILPELVDRRTMLAIWTGKSAELPFSVQIVTGFPLIGLILSVLLIRKGSRSAVTDTNSA